MGRHSEYTLEMANKICDHISKGKSLVDIGKMKDMPTRACIYNWMKKHPEFVDMYTRAREERADLYADEIIKIADEATDANLARVQIDARKWVASKLNAKKYGESRTLKGDDKEPIVVDLNITPAKETFLAAISEIAAEDGTEEDR